MLVAYERGRKHERQLSVQDFDEEMGNKYTDNEHKTAKGLMVLKESWQDVGLGPVLAFLESNYGGYWGIGR